MPVVDAIKAAILRVDGSQVGNVFGNSAQVAVEMADLANEVARDIALSHDWRRLMAIAAIVGDGVTESYTLPADYDRMTLAGGVENTDEWLWGYEQFSDISALMRAQARGWMHRPGGWLVMGNQIHFYPAPDGEARFPYIRKHIVQGSSSKDAFTADDDVFLLEDRLLTLGLIWRWRAQKGLQYAEDLQTYELGLSKAQANDRGARMLGQTRRNFRGAHPAWPWALG
jgi:hypothetical protein